MRLVIDLQGAQTASRRRGIGRYSLALAQAIGRQANNHEVWLALNGAFPSTISDLRAAFENVIPQERIVVWEGPTPVAEIDPANQQRRQVAEIMRETFLARLKPDIVYVSSLFEGVTDDGVTSVGGVTNSENTAITLYDLIPFISPEKYLTNPILNAHYQRKLTSLRRAGLWLAISESSRNEGIDWLDLQSDKVVNISTAADARFRPIKITKTAAESLRKRYGLNRSFIMYTGTLDAADPRKNVSRLLGAYARLPSAVRRRRQLLLVSPAQDWEIVRLKKEARRRGCRESDITIAQNIPDDDLVALYNLCAVFCFPSLHEGFGLPALEAMQCGAPVIGSNVSSIPEVIGLRDALFDPYDEKDITRLLLKVLTNKDFRRRLKEHGLNQARTFSWDESARRAWGAFEAHHAELTARAPAPARDRSPPLRLAYVSPLAPERSGISDYSAELLPELARHYDIDVIVDQSSVDDAWINNNCTVRRADWFDRNANTYDRILYHFGNSPFHSHMFDLLARHPGAVVLHDFYLSAVISHEELCAGRRGHWMRALYESHGYGAAREWAQTKDVAAIKYKYPVNFSVLKHAAGVIVHSNYSQRLTERFYGAALGVEWAVFPHMRAAPAKGDRYAARRALGFQDDDFVLCSFGLMDETKLNHRLLEAWTNSQLSADKQCHLVFVGGEHGGDYGASLRKTIDASSGRARIKITGFASRDVYEQYLWAADAAIQVRANSRGETSGAVLDCLARSLPIVTNRHGPLAELPEQCVVMLPDEFTTGELRGAIEALRRDSPQRIALGERARSFVKESLAPRAISDQYFTAIERFYASGVQTLRTLALEAATDVIPENWGEQELTALARAIDWNLPQPQPQQQLLVDVSANVATNLKTGIERVVQAQVLELLRAPPPGFRVEPVYIDSHGGRLRYRYARKYASKLLGLDDEALDDAPVDVRAGDIFYGVDYFPDGVASAAREGLYAKWRERGVKIKFLVYDLLPVNNPEFFPDFSRDIHAHWLNAIAGNAEQVVCISQATAEEFSRWFDEGKKECGKRPAVAAVHLGADFINGAASVELPDEASALLAQLSDAPSFLMVGTIEPRKGHKQTIAAFERLWREGVKANLVIVGAEGWKPLPDDQRRTIPETVEKLRNHPELGKRLFWLEGVSDEFLGKLYSAAACLIAASEAEGFGLPLIEAAQRKIPILARDIPVFREVAGAHADYFSGANADCLAEAIKDWLALYDEGRHPKSDDMPWMTWAESVARLKDVLLGDDICSQTASQPAAVKLRCEWPSVELACSPAAGAISQQQPYHTDLNLQSANAKLQ